VRWVWLTTCRRPLPRPVLLPLFPAVQAPACDSRIPVRGNGTRSHEEEAPSARTGVDDAGRVAGFSPFQDPYCDMERITNHNPQPPGIRAKFSPLVAVTRSGTMGTQLNTKQLPPHSRRKMPYLSVKTLGAISNWQADMKVDRRGRNPSFRIAKM